jgi:hypothetical protein
VFPSSKGRDLSDCHILAGQRLAILLSLCETEPRRPLLPLDSIRLAQKRVSLVSPTQAYSDPPLSS